MKIEGESYTLYHGDCLDILPTLDAGSVDAVITDPPYGIGFKYNTHDDRPSAYDEHGGYGAWIWRAIEMSESRCKGGSPIFCWQAMSNVRYFAQWFPRDFRLFAACKNFVQMRQVAMQHAYEPVIVWWTDGDPWFAGTASRDWHIGNTANTMNRGNGDSMGHPCARPLDQIKHIAEQWVRPFATILDPFMGSGTTGVAALLTGRKFIGIELDLTYFDIAHKRIEDTARQMRGEFKPLSDDQAHDDLPLFRDIA